MIDHSQLGVGTQCVHGAWRKAPESNSVAVPIHQNVAYLFDSVDHAVNLFQLAEVGNIYSRITNPTNTAFEERMALLEGGIGAVSFASGQAATHAALVNIARSGDNIVTSPYLYGGVWNLLMQRFVEAGIEVRTADPDRPETFAEKTDKRTRAYYAESLPNPRLSVLPIAEIAQIGKQFGVPLVVDNTSAPLLCRPFEHGAAVVVYSTTKYIGGHANSIGGAVIDSGQFDWNNAINPTPALTEPDPSYNNDTWVDKVQPLGPIAYILRLRACILRDLGACMSPFNAFLFLQGLETLHLRMAAHCKNAEAVVAYLQSHPQVQSVNYPGQQNPDFDANAQKYLKGGNGGLLGFELKGGREAGGKFINALKLLYHVANIGDARSLAVHPATTTHGQLSETELAEAGISPGYIRLSIGIEDSKDIIADIAQAIASSH